MKKAPKVLLVVTVSRVLLVCLVLQVLKAHQERMVTRSDSPFGLYCHSLFLCLFHLQPP